MRTRGDRAPSFALAILLLGIWATSACSPAKITVPGTSGGGGSGAPGVPGFTVPDGGGMPGKPPPCGPSIEGENRPCPDAAPPAPPPRPPAPDAAPSVPVPPPPPPMAGCTGEGPVEVQVRAWGATPTCVYLKAGQTAEITATGRWTGPGRREVGPEGAAPNEEGCPRGALVARVAKFHQRTCIRAKGSITAQRDGYVWLYQSGGWNAMEVSGAITATVTGGGRSNLPYEGLTPLADDPRVDPGRIQAFESVCGQQMIPVHFEAQEPNNPRVRAYVDTMFGGDPVKTISRWIVVGCALFYATPADYPKAHRDRRVRVVHYIGTTNRWPDLHRPPLRNARGEHWDFELTKTLEEITSMQPDYGPFGGPPVSIMHEVGHLISPDGAGGKLPKWLQETYAETLPSNLGGPNGFHNAIDNPESVRFGARDWWWCDGTFGGPTFMDFIDERHPGFIHFMSAQSLRIGRNGAWPGSDTLFRMHTGQSFDALWAAYADAYLFRANKRVEECLDPRE